MDVIDLSARDFVRAAASCKTYYDVRRRTTDIHKNLALKIEKKRRDGQICTYYRIDLCYDRYYGTSSEGKSVTNM